MKSFKVVEKPNGKFDLYMRIEVFGGKIPLGVFKYQASFNNMRDATHYITSTEGDNKVKINFVLIRKQNEDNKDSNR